MLVTELYDGQGFGNQLWCYVVTRVLALDKGFEFGIQNHQRFKGSDFLQPDFGLQVNGGSGPAGGPPEVLPNTVKHYYSERDIRHPANEFDVRTYDSGLLDVLDDTKIDGVLQSEDYISHRKSEIAQWLKYSIIELDINFHDENICVINFRGGEYKRNPNVFLRRRYWRDSVAHMCTINPSMEFVVITDDVDLARKFFPKFRIRHYGIAGDYQAINCAKYVILSNSSFGFFPAWLSTRLEVCIAPKYWWAHNTSDGFWACSYNITRDWLYMDRDGRISDYEQCIRELGNYQEVNKSFYEQRRIIDSFVLVSSFNHDLSWLPRYTDNYMVFERGLGSGIPPQLDREKIRNVSNNGSNFADYFTYIIENYESLPEVVFLIKGNVFPRHVRQHIFDTYTNKREPCSIIDRKEHRTNFPLDFFGKDGMYRELNTDWFVHTGVPWKHFQSLDSLLSHFDRSLKRKLYTRFTIGAEYITTREYIQKIPKSIYEDLLQIVSHGGQPIGYTAECYIVERAFDRLLQGNFRLTLDGAGYPLPIANDLAASTPIRLRLFFIATDLVAKLINTPARGAIRLWRALGIRKNLILNYYFR